jgi:copper chaperone CopZ
MRFKYLAIPVLLLSGLALTVALAAPPAESKVTLSGVHLCCDNCVNGVTTALKPVTGVSATCDKAASTVALTAADKDTLQKAVDALIAAGYYGKSSDAAVKISTTTGAPEGKVKTLDIAGVHLCCNSCVTAVKGVLAKVDGVKTDTVKTRATSFTVTGDFDAKSVFTELQKAGLTGKVAPAAAAIKP